MDIEISSVIDNFAESFSKQLKNKDAKQDFFRLQTSAKNLLKEANKYNMENFSKAALSKKLQSLPDNGAEKKSESIINTENQKQDYYFSALYKIAFQFDDELTKFLKMQPKSALFVKETDRGLETYELTMSQLIDLADEKGSLKQENLSEEYKTNLKESIIDKKHVEYSMSAYSGTNNRLNRFFEVARVTRKQNGILLFKKDSKWIGARVLNKGDLKESYVALLLSDHQEKIGCSLEKYPEGSNPYYSHDLISYFFYNYIKKVTNLAAIIQEDVSTKDKQYAVKGTGASLPGLNQYIKMANYINNINYNSNLLIEKDDIITALKEMKLNQDVERNVELFSADVTDILIDELSPFLNNLKFTADKSSIAKAARSKAKTDKGIERAIEKKILGIAMDIKY